MTTKMGDTPLWLGDLNHPKKTNYRHLCLISVLLAFAVGLSLGVLIPAALQKDGANQTEPLDLKLNALDQFEAVSFLEDSLLVEDGVFWGSRVEGVLPQGYDDDDGRLWNGVVASSVAVRLEPGCGRMQNRLVTYRDGTKGCVRYRQNLDQIQGELFSFYLGRLLKLPNLVPSAVDVVDMTSKTWGGLHNEIASAQWASNRPIVITRYVDGLINANIPKEYRPPDKNLSHRDVLGGDIPDLEKLAELAQWSDLVIFDYLTANLDRVVNNLYNRQWNSNIMDSPAHNLARSDDLLVFLDNESGLLHGYRLLQKYEIYHDLLLSNLCLFRRSTVQEIQRLRGQDVGELLLRAFEKNSSGKVRDVLPPLPEKSVKILNERLDRVLAQVARCRDSYLGGV